MSLITCENVSMGYEGKTVLENVNFQINTGDYICIVGENGSGKSTLMKGLLKLKNPDQGTISIGDGLKAQEIGYLPQQSELQRNFPASVYEVILSGRLNQLKWKPFFSKEDKVNVIEKMEMMGIKHLKNQSYQELSGGQQQRVLLARALCATTKMLLLDEPMAGLDPVVTNDIYQRIKDVNQTYGITIVMISHDITMAVKYATNILHLGKSQLYFGSAEDYQMSQLGRRFMGGEDNA